MDEEDIDRDPEGSGPSLLEIAEDYLSNELDEDAAEAFEKRLSHDSEAREALIQALTIRGLVDLAFERIEQAHDADEEDGEEESDETPARPSTCRSSRALMPAYRRGSLDAGSVAELSRHLESCPACAAWYEAYDKAVPIRTRRHSWIRVAALILAGGVLFGPIGWWLASGRAPLEAPGAPAGMVWPAVPLPVEDMGRIGEALRDRSGTSDEDAVATAAAHARKEHPGYLDAMAEHPLVAESLGILGGTGGVEITGAARDEIVLLLLFLNDGRVNAQMRKEALEPLSDRLPGDGGRQLLARIATSTSQVLFLKEALEILHTKGWRPEDAALLHAVEQRALHSANPGLVEVLLHGLCMLDPEGCHSLAMSVLRGNYGTFAGTEFPQAAHQLYAACDRLAVPDPTRDLRTIVEDLACPSPCRMQASRKLWVATRDPRWLNAFLGFSGDPDWRARMGVTSLVPSDYRDEDRPTIEQLTSDSHVQVANCARRLLEDLRKPRD